MLHQGYVAEIEHLEKPPQPSLIQTFSAIIVAAIGWGSGNVISRSLLIEGIDEIYLITIRVVVIGTILKIGRAHV